MAGAQEAPGNGTQEVQKPRWAPNRSHWASPKSRHCQWGRQWHGGLPRPLPQGKQPFGGGARTDGSLRDSWTRPQAESSTEPLAQGQRLGAGVGPDSHNNKGCNAFVLSTTSVSSSGDRARCKALQSLRTLTPFIASHRAQLQWASASPQQQNQRIVESLRLEKTSKITKSNHQSITTVPTKPRPQVPRLHVFWTPRGMVTSPLPWASCSNAVQLFSKKIFPEEMMVQPPLWLPSRGPWPHPGTPIPPLFPKTF